MAIANAKVSVKTTATALNAASDDWVHLRVSVPSGGNPVYLGNSSVTTSTGSPLAAGESLELTLPPGDVLYGRAGSDQDVYVLQVS